MLAALHILNALFGFVMCAAVWRAAPDRRENRLLAKVGVIDSATITAVGVLLLSGHSLTSDEALVACTVGRILICYPALALFYQFPFDERPPRALTAGAVAASAAALVLSLHPATTWFGAVAPAVFFLPLFLLTLRVLVRNVARLHGQGDTTAPLVILWAVVGRWAAELIAYGVVRRFFPGAFAVTLAIDNTVLVLASYVAIAYAILRHQLFGVRGVLAELGFYGMSALLVLVLVTLSVNLVLLHVSSPRLQVAALVGVSAMPLLLFHGVRWLRPRLEARWLGPLDPRRAAREGALGRAVSATAGLDEPQRVLDVTRQALVGVTGGGEVRFLSGPALWEWGNGAGLPVRPADDGRLGPALAERLARDQDVHHLHRPRAHGLSAEERAELEALPAELLVPVRMGRRLWGALAVAGGTVDRDTVLTAVALADNFVVKLEAFALFRRSFELQGELEGTRRLAALGSFAAAVAHDIRTPLTSVQMNIQMLRAKARLPAADMESFDIALEELRRLNSHISEILDFAKPIQIHAAAVDLRELSEDAARRLEPMLDEKTLVLEQRHQGDLPLVQADPQRLRQVLLNLVDNAAEASAAGSAIVIATRTGPPGRVVVEVSDRGKGIAAEHLPKIFEPFFTTRADGTGLGLAIVQKVVKAHGGEIDVRSRPGEGATFTVMLPVRRTD